MGCFSLPLEKKMWSSYLLCVYCARAQSYKPSHPSGRTGDPDDEPSENDYSHGFGNARGGGGGLQRENFLHSAVLCRCGIQFTFNFKKRVSVCVYSVCVCCEGGALWGKPKACTTWCWILHIEIRERERKWGPWCSWFPSSSRSAYPWEILCCL